MNSVCKYTKYSWYCVACKTKRIKKGMFLWQKRNLVLLSSAMLLKLLTHVKSDENKQGHLV